MKVLTEMPRMRLFDTGFWRTMRQYLGLGRFARPAPITDRPGLVQFIETRAAHVAQTSLYGYLRTRAGTRYRDLFFNERFLVSINIAKWQIWLACVSDLSIYAGEVICLRAPLHPDRAGRLMQTVVDELLRAVGTPAEAGADFSQHAQCVRARLRARVWGEMRDEQEPFAQSPGALVQWAPVVDELRQLDEEIVRNSVRFRWQEVRRDFQRDLLAQAFAGPGGASL